MFTAGQVSHPVAYSYPLRSSTALLFFHLFTAQITLIIVTLMVHLFLDNLTKLVNFKESLNALQLTFILLSQVAAALFALVSFFKWIHTIYLIQPNQIVKKQGIINVVEEIYSTDPIAEVMIKQSWLGRILQYGTLEITNPLLRQIYSLSNIPHPYFYASVIQETELEKNDPHIRYFPLPETFDSERLPKMIGNTLLSTDS